MTILTLLSETTYGTESGNYDGSTTNFTSDAVRAADYYRLMNASQTVIFALNDFEGAIVIQGTLVKEPVDTDWVDLYEIPADSSAITTNSSTTLTGNFVWIRASVSGFIGGTINSITTTY